MWIVVALILVLFIYGFWEYRNHQRNLDSIPIRVHINGSRGKSSVTRLIGAGLRAGGRRVFTKTTGSSPRMILESGEERTVIRPGRANIIEQLKVMRSAVSRGVETVVLECMGIQPHLQYVLEHQMVRSTVGVITNVRPDHLDEMGPGLEEVAAALCNTIPRGGVLFTAERERLPAIRRRAEYLGTTVQEVDSSNISGEELSGFTYLEHKENVALALLVCDHLGVPKETALAGMYAANPDPGVLRLYRLEYFDKRIDFVMAFAANDSLSYSIIWERLDLSRERSFPEEKLIVLVSSRSDRIQRAEQLGEFIATEISGDHFLIVGEYTTPLVNKALSSGLPRSKIANMGGRSAEEVFEKAVSLVEAKATVVGVGNIVGFGEEVAQHFINRGRELVFRDLDDSSRRAWIGD